ncbi:MAG: ABC transporter permease [Alphaproteobacteria bacterium]|nr:ABC transporter permease [Alphaproteobacteria bacterium]
MDGLSPTRIGAMVLRYLYLCRGSWPRLLDIVYWPTMQMILWGLVTQFFIGTSSWLAGAAGVLIAGVLLWDVMFRGQLGVSVLFMEELHARNLGNLFVSPLRAHELLLAMTIMSLLRAVFGLGVAAGLANLLIFGWAVALMICGLLMRYGLGAESMAWVVIFAVQPLCAIYYPVTTLPSWLQDVAWAIPPSYVFEGMRRVLVEGVFDPGLFWPAVWLNLLWLAAGAAVFLLAFRAARTRGLLIQMGE